MPAGPAPASRALLPAALRSRPRAQALARPSFVQRVEEPRRWAARWVFLKTGACGREDWAGVGSEAAPRPRPPFDPVPLRWYNADGPGGSAATAGPEAQTTCRLGSEESTTMDIQGILAILPHRYPFLLVDRVLELEPGVRAVGIKNVTVNEPFFAGHWPDQPVMPGVLILEAMAQVGGIMLLSMLENRKRVTAFMAGLDGVKFRRRVVPGDQLVIEAVMERRKGYMGRVHIVARVEAEVACEGDFTFALVADQEEPASKLSV
jgi:3-hydroxyacyl-[acyl-carrier-protein] dehydratase